MHEGCSNSHYIGRYRFSVSANWKTEKVRPCDGIVLQNSTEETRAGGPGCPADLYEFPGRRIRSEKGSMGPPRSQAAVGLASACQRTRVSHRRVEWQAGDCPPGLARGTLSLRNCESRTTTGLRDLTMRVSMRRFTRLNNAFSKRVENHAAAISRRFMYYHLARIRETLRSTPAMRAGGANHRWAVKEFIGLV